MKDRHGWLLVVFSCACAADASQGDPGRETGPCIDDACLGGELVCLSDLCVDPNAVATTGGVGSDPSASGDPSADSESSANPSDTGASTACGGDDCGACVAPTHTPCDEGTDDPAQALGLGCEGEAALQVTVDGSPMAIGVRTGFGSSDTWAPREGAAFAVIGTGLVSELDMPPPKGDLDHEPANCNDDLGAFDPGGTLPDPLRAIDVAGDCVADPTLVGTGDCSNTIEGQLAQGVGAADYTELRIRGTVPPSVSSMSYSFAFFSAEYPYYYGDQFNDMFVAWLESERWTGNISFDAQGNPISLNAGFLDYRDDGGGRVEFAGTCIARHAGTSWLSSVAPVTAGEEITVVFGVFDVSDSLVDSFVFLDAFQWGCEQPDRPGTVASD